MQGLPIIKTTKEENLTDDYTEFSTYDFDSDDSSYMSVMTSDSLDDGEIKKERVIIYFILLSALGLVGFLIWAPYKLYILETPCCVCDSKFTVQNPPVELEDYIKANSGKIYYNNDQLNHLLEEDVHKCLAIAESYFIDASYAYDENVDQFDDFKNTTETLLLVGHNRTCSFDFDVHYEENDEGENEITNGIGKNATQMKLACDKTQIQSLFNVTIN